MIIRQQVSPVEKTTRKVAKVTFTAKSGKEFSYGVKVTDNGFQSLPFGLQKCDIPQVLAHCDNVSVYRSGDWIRFSDGETEYQLCPAESYVCCACLKNSDGSIDVFAATARGGFSAQAGDVETPAITCLCSHNGRLFGMGSGGKLYYSAQFSCDWQGGGYVDLGSDGGDCIALVSNGNLFVVRRNEITVLSAYADPAEFVVKCRILSNFATAAAACDDGIAYFADGLLNFFDSKTVKNYPLPFEPANAASSASFCGTYAAVLETKPQKYALSEHYLLLFHGGEMQFYRLNERSAVSADKDGFLLCGGNAYRLTHGAQPQCRAVGTFAENSALKTLRSVTFTADADCILTAVTENCRKSLAVFASHDAQTVYVNATGRQIYLLFESPSALHVTGAAATFDECIYKGETN